MRLEVLVYLDCCRMCRGRVTEGKGGVALLATLFTLKAQHDRVWARSGDDIRIGKNPFSRIEFLNLASTRESDGARDGQHALT